MLSGAFLVNLGQKLKGRACQGEGIPGKSIEFRLGALRTTSKE